MRTFFQNILFFIRAELVFCTAAAGAILTMLFVPPSGRYLAYFDFRVISLLFCLMVVVSGFQKTGIFLIISERILKRVKTLRSLSFVLVMLCFFSSILITNDVALITFVPFAVLLLTLTDQKPSIIRVIVLQTIAANLGSMLTPIGNPQNLYLYTKYEIPVLEFFKITFPYAAASFVLLCVIIFITKKEPLHFTLPDNKKNFEKYRKLLPVYMILFLLCLACVLRLCDYRILLAVVLLTVFLFDIPILKRVDYTLLLTFACFFLFVGNISNMTMVKDFFAGLLIDKEIPTAIVLSQMISNVPAAVLLSAFTNNYKGLILGTNIGGLGTLTASLASLITYKIYSRTQEANKSKYLKVFTLYNLLFLAALCLFIKFGKYVMIVFMFLLIF